MQTSRPSPSSSTTRLTPLPPCSTTSRLPSPSMAMPRGRARPFSRTLYSTPGAVTGFHAGFLPVHCAAAAAAAAAHSAPSTSRRGAIVSR